MNKDECPEPSWTIYIRKNRGERYQFFHQRRAVDWLSLYHTLDIVNVEGIESRNDVR